MTVTFRTSYPFINQIELIPTPTYPTLKIYFPKFETDSSKPLDQERVSVHYAQTLGHTITSRFSIPCRITARVCVSEEDRNSYFQKDPSTGISTLKASTPADMIFCPEGLIIYPETKLRSVLDWCRGSLKCEDCVDTAVVQPYIEAAERDFSITDEQKELIRNTAQKHIDAIIKTCLDATAESFELGSTTGIDWKEAFDLTSKREIAFAMLLQSMQGHPGYLCLDLAPGFLHYADASKLHALYCGDKNLDFYFKLLGKLPTIEAQRKVLIEHLQERLDQYYGVEPAPVTTEFPSTLIREIRSELFIQGCRLDAVDFIDGTVPNKICISTTKAVLDGLKGEFAVPEVGYLIHTWMQDGKEISPDLARARFIYICEQAKTRI